MSTEKRLNESLVRGEYAPPQPQSGVVVGGGPAMMATNAAAMRLLGITRPAPVDEGFDGSHFMETEVVEVRPGSVDLDLSSLETKSNGGEKLRSLAIVAGCVALAPFGIPYLLQKLTLVRTGEIAMVRSIAGDCRVLGAGWHILDTVTCDVMKANVNDNLMRLGPLTLARVLPGYVGIGTQNGHPCFLASGIHLIKDPFFSWIGAQAMTEPYISAMNTLHLITVQRGKLGLVLADSKGHFLGDGRHVISHPRFKFIAFRDASEEWIQVGSKHRIMLPAGRIGLAWESGQALILHSSDVPLFIDSPTFKFERSVPATQQVVKHGSVKLVTVRQGFVGVSFRDGALDVLPPGRHQLTSPTHAISGFLPTGQQTLSVAKVVSLTSDNVALEFDAAITVQVVDAKKAIITLAGTNSMAQAAANGGEAEFDPSTVWANVCLKAKLALTIIMGSSNLNSSNGPEDDNSAAQPGRAPLPDLKLGTAPAEAFAAAEANLLGFDRHVVGAAGAAMPHPSAPYAVAGSPAAEADDEDPSPAAGRQSLKARIHDVFMADFALKMLNQCGIAVIDMSVEDVRISDPELAAAMARGAVARADLAKAGIEKLVRLTSSEAEKQSTILAAEGKAQATYIIAKAEADRVRTLDDALSSLKSATSQQREILLAAGEVMKSCGATMVLSQSPGDAASMLASTTALSAMRALGNGK